MFRAPSHAGLPALSTLLDDLPANDRQIAKHLGLQPSTLATYRRNDCAPRAVMLALFWETRWGRSVADTEAHNYGVVNAGMAKAAQDHNRRMAGVIWRLEVELEKAAQAGGAVPANLPVFRTG